MTRPYGIAGLKAYAYKLIDDKLTGQPRIEARWFVGSHNEPRHIRQLITRLAEKPDINIDPELRRKVDQSSKPRKRVNDETEAQMRADRAAGMTLKAIGEKYQVSYDTAWRKTHDVEITSPLQRKDKHMATRQAMVENLARRCEDVGWKVTRGGKHIKIFTPDSGPYPIASTPSDTRSIKNAEADLLRLGLREAEQRKAVHDMADRTQRLNDDRRRALERAEQLQAKADEARRQEDRQRAAVVRAAGPYLVEAKVMPMSFYTDRHPVPRMEWVVMTPELAEYLLEFHNKPGAAGEAGKNRPQLKRQIERYRNIMLSGQWRPTHQGMAMDSDGWLQDGQHRLEALRQAGRANDDLEIVVPFFVGMPPDNFKALDEGLLRNAAQLFTRDGEANANVIQSAVRLVNAYGTGGEDARLRERQPTTNAEILDRFGHNPDALREAARVANSHAKKVPMTVGPFAAAHYLLHVVNGTGNRFVDRYIDGLLKGYLERDGDLVLLPADDPRAAVRKTLRSFKERTGRAMRPMEQIGVVLTGWNKLVLGRHGSTAIKWSKETPIPEILICKDDGVTAPPRALRGEISMRQEEGSGGA